MLLTAQHPFVSLDRYGHLRQKDDNHHDEAAVTVSSSKNDDPRSIAALLEGRRRRSSSGGLLTKATNHGGLDKSCHPATITQSENDSTTSTRLHKSNASRVLLDDYLGSKAKHACITKECEKKIKWSNRIIPWSFSICNPTAQLQCWPSKDASEASSCFKNLIIFEECLETISL